MNNEQNTIAQAIVKATGISPELAQEVAFNLSASEQLRLQGKLGNQYLVSEVVNEALARRPKPTRDVAPDPGATGSASAPPATPDEPTPAASPATPVPDPIVTGDDGRSTPDPEPDSQPDSEPTVKAGESLAEPVAPETDSQPDS